MKLKKTKKAKKPELKEEMLRTMLALNYLSQIRITEEMYSLSISLINYIQKICKYFKMNPEIAERLWEQSIISVNDPYIQQEAEKNIF
jgi:5-formyltetrahydrofolate cyclo-ligase